MSICRNRKGSQSLGLTGQCPSFLNVFNLLCACFSNSTHPCCRSGWARPMSKAVSKGNPVPAPGHTYLQKASPTRMTSTGAPSLHFMHFCAPLGREAQSKALSLWQCRDQHVIVGLLEDL